MVLVHEGGYVDNPKDPGGATNKGVTQAVYDGWRRSRDLPKRPVSQLGDDELELIYRERFWETVRGDSLPAGIDYATFDGSVNSGPTQAAKWLQRALKVTADGKIGPQTIAAAHAANAAAVIDDMLDQRLAFMKKIKHRSTGELLWTTFGRGWQKRIDGVRRDAKAMVAVPPDKPLRPIPEAETITHRDVKKTGKQGLLIVILAAIGGIVAKLLGVF
jgi:lysozyme family protein